jgi:DNA-binding NtrC family response regulator
MGYVPSSLSADGGMRANGLPRAQDVLQALQEATADLVISDIKTPEMDGMTLLQEVKRTSP